MKHTTTLFAALLTFLSVNAQNDHPCATDFLHQQALQNSVFFKKHQAIEQEALDFFTHHTQSATERGSQVVTVPVVVHIIHDNGPENISDAQVQQAIQWLNQSFANAGYYAQGSGAEVGIQFCLAQRTPSGQPTNGITRDQSTLTTLYIEGNDGAMKNINRWAPKDYINIWVLRDICSATYGCGVVAYAYHPAYHGSNLDGIVVEAGYFGTTPGYGSILAHELGHYFGLYHTFEGGCSNGNCLSNGDRVCDTPPDQSTAAVPCDQPANTCSTDTQSGFATDQPDMNQNFLDYGNLNCQHDFTPGQADRMNFYLNGTRKSLLASKGCLPPCPLPVLAAFSLGDTTILAGQTLLFNNNSQNAVIFSWTINGIPFGGQQNAAYLFDSAGVFTIKLVAQPLDGQLCEADSAQVTVQVTCPVVADFSVSNLYPEEGQTVFLTNNSQNANQFEWFVNGVSQGAVLDSVVFTESGSYEIRLVAVGSFCSSSVTQSVQVRDSCTSKTFVLQYDSGGFQNPGWTGSSSTVLADGSLLFCGSGALPNMFQRAFFLKMKPGGTHLWTKLMGRDSAYMSCDDVVATPDGGFAALIRYQKDQGLGLPQLTAFYLSKLSPDGATQWVRKLNEYVFDQSEFYDLILTFDGGIIAGARTKFDMAGNLLWHNTQPNIEAFKSALMPDGGFVAAGRDFGLNINQIARYDTNGNLLWAKLFDPVGKFVDVAVGADGNIFVLGRKAGNIITYNHTWLLKLTPEGEIVWSKFYLRQQTSIFNPHSIVATDDGLTICADSRIIPVSYAAMLHLDNDGEIIWLRHFEDYSLNGNISAIPGGGFLGIGRNIYVVNFFKTDALGYAGECPDVPWGLHYENLPVSSAPIAVSTTVTPDFPLDTLSVIDVQITLDTICAPACPRGIELCNNNLDDDGDGLFDCLDPDCDCAEDVCAPGEAKIWYFGNKAGLDFNTEPPTVLTDGLTNNNISSAVMCDVRGNLLFYTVGNTVFNRFHQMMPNGDSLSPTSFGTSLDGHGTIAIPHPGEPGLFYLFCINPGVPGGGSWFSLIDMKLDGGKGDVVVGMKAMNLTNSHVVEPHPTAVRSCAFEGYWLVVESRFPSHRYLAFRIDENGLNLTPVISSAGMVSSTIFSGQMKCSPDGKKLAKAINTAQTIQLGDFDEATGVVSNLKVLNFNFTEPYGIEFSPSGRYLYATTFSFFNNEEKVVQFDTDAGSGIMGSLKTVASGGHYGVLQLAPNGKIYGGAYGSFVLDIIHEPNLPAPACQFQKDGLPLGGLSSLYGGLVNVPQNLFAQPTVAIHPAAPDTICILDSLYTYTIEKSGCFKIDSTKWTMEGLTGTLYSEFYIGWIKFDAPGEGQLIYTLYTECGAVSDTLHIVVAEPFDKTPDLGPDRVVCDNGVFTLNAGSGFARYRWQNGSPDSVLTTLLPGKYWVDVWDACGNQQSDTVTVSIAPATDLELGDAREGCPDLTEVFQRPDFFSHWKWSPADFLSCDNCASVTVSPAATISWIVVAQTDDGCISVDTVMFQIQDTLFFELDTSVCADQMIDLFGMPFPADTTVQFFFPALGLGCDTLLTIKILGLDAPFLAIEKTICANEFFTYKNVLLPADTTAVFVLPGTGSECDSVVTVVVKSYPPLTVMLPPDTTLRVGATLILKAETSGTGTLNFQWSPADGLSCNNCPAPEVAPLETTLYALSVADANGCRAQDSVLVTIDLACVVIIPNAFTPNGDGINDFFYPKTDPCVRRVRVWRVVSRWGEMVFERQNFEPGNPNLGWDGTRTNGEAFPSDVLVWYAELEYYDGRVEVRKGDVALLR